MNMYHKKSQERAIAKSNQNRIDYPNVRSLISAEYNYTEDEMEFILAMQEYIRITGHKFPGHSEVLKVIVSLGYTKCTFNS